jgi:predicted nucleotidyltransferase
MSGSMSDSMSGSRSGSRRAPTPYPEINHLLETLLKGVQEVLGTHFVGMYLDGSLAGGDFDQDSDIDFVVVTEHDLSIEKFTALQALHDRLAEMDSAWAIQLEGFYISSQAIRRYDPQSRSVPNIERGRGERLKWVELDRRWEIHRSMLRKQGITLAGPAPQTLIDPVSPVQLQQTMLFLLSEWIARFLVKPELLNLRGYQSYIVLSICRILYTLQEGEVVSKRYAVGWARENLSERWENLLDETWQGRHHPELPSTARDIKETMEFIRYALESSQKFKHLPSGAAS